MEELSEVKFTSGGKKILFIDDDQDYVESVKLLLEKKYEIATAFSAEDGWEKIEKENPDLIILDVMMEPKSGFTLARELKTHSTYKDIPIVMLTGVVTKITETKYTPDDILRYEGEEFVEKSAPKEELFNAIKKQIG